MHYPIETIGNWQKRVIEGGWLQYRELRRDGTFGNWQFQVHGFDDSVTGQAGYCTVANIDTARHEVPIDACDRILINGRRYGRDHWNH